MSETGTATVLQQTSNPETPLYKVSWLGHNTRWPMRLEGRDETGRERVLALDWDGRWHRFSPTSGAEILKAGDFADGELGRRADGRVVRRANAHRPGMYPMSDRYEVAFVAMAEDGGRVLFIDANEDLEVMPRGQQQPRTQRADQFNVGDLAMHAGLIWRRIKTDVSIEHVAFTSDGENVLLVDADTEMEVAP